MSTPRLALRNDAIATGQLASEEHAPGREIPPGLPESRIRYLAQSILAVVAIVLLSPVLALVALAVKLSSKGPLFYGGVRVGKNQQLYTVRLEAG